MAEIILCYAREDAATAGRLAGAVKALGYRLWSEADLGGGEAAADVTDRISGAKAAIVIWSEAAAASEWVRAEANFARGQKKLIQAAIDDRPPPLPFRSADAVSIAGWQGEQSHPGWRRIEAALASLCGPPAAAAGPARPDRAPAPPPAARRRRGSATLIVAATLVLLAAVALATFLWMQDLAPRGAAEKAAPTAPTAAFPAPAAPSPPPPLPSAEPAAAEPPPEEVEREAGPQPAPRPAGPRIIRENAANMRLFCERAGRGTPECRTFARRLRNQRR